MNVETGFVKVNGAKLYYERAGAGPSLVMIHAGIADCRMWEHEFAALADSYQTLRFDMRGYGRSLPVARLANSTYRLTSKVCWTPWKYPRPTS